ncbi:MAG: sulfatase-like hydrolase/transferase [Verrucomicrobiaceae bacterium]
MKKRFLTISLVALPLLQAASLPNIILIMADDMGFADPSYVSQNVLKADGTPHPDQGWISTPVMDDMAANGLVFNRFYSASAQCSPTRASCLTGRNPIRVGIPLANSGRIGADETPLSTILAAKGYRTGHFGKWHMGTMTTLRDDSNRGANGNLSEYAPPWFFSYDTCFATEAKVPTYHPYRITNNSAALPTSFADNNFYGTRYWRTPLGDPLTAAEGTMVTVNEVNNTSDGDDSKLVTNEAINFITSAVNEDKPFFCVIWYHTPHKPVMDPDGVTARDSNDALKDSIEDMDTAIGNLRTALDSAGARGNTMIWLTSDNGPEDGIDSPNETDPSRSFRSGSLRERKRSLYEGGIRVPGILEWPDVITSSRTTDFVSSTSDYYPTILDYLDLAAETQLPLDGVSLRPVIEGTATVRSAPIGFIHDGDEAYIAQNYKITRPENTWELWDMTVPDHQKETAALATQDNIASQPQAIQDIYHELVSGFDAWEATANADTSFVDSTVPTTTLSTATTSSDTSFTFTATFGQPMTGLSTTDFSAAGALISNLTGSGTTYTLTAIPDRSSDIVIRLPQGAAFGTDGTPNATSNTLNITVPNQLTIASGDCITGTFDGTSFATIDATGLTPANGSNNLDKFSTVEGAPYTTTLYVRGSNNNDNRKVRAFLKFDLAAMAGFSEISRATLTFNAYSLNNTQGANNLQAGASSVDGLTAPSFTAPIIGSYVAGGNVADNTGLLDINEYSFDVTNIVQTWLDGSVTNNGFFITLEDITNNNGIGIDLSAGNLPTLEVCDAIPLKLINSLNIIEGHEITTRLLYQGSLGVPYHLYGSNDLNTWTLLETRNPTSSLGIFTHESDDEKLFYRIGKNTE